MTYCTKNEAAKIIASQIELIASNKILVLLSGGSSAAVGVAALALVDQNILPNISVMLADERYVSYGSTESNATLLKQLGIATICQNFTEVLSSDNLSRLEVTASFTNNLKLACQNNDTIVAVYGVGYDNHIAGILPNSNAANSLADYACDYVSDQFERITISPKFFNNIDVAYIYAEGSQKAQAVQTIEQDHDVINFPSQLIKKAKKWQLLYNKENV